MRSIAILSILLTLAGCSNLQRNLSNLIFPPNVFSDRRQGEQVQVKLSYNKDREEVAGASRFIEPTSIAFVAGLAISQAQQFLKTESEKYSATYTGIAVGDTFYESNAPAAAINLKAISVRREVDNDKAMEFCALVVPTLDKTAFRIFPAYLQVHRAKAKLIGFDWLAPFGFDLLAPWTIFQNKLRLTDNDVDVTIDLDIHGVWVDKEQKAHNESLAKQQLKFTGVVLNQNDGGGTLLLKTKKGAPKLTCDNISDYMVSDVILTDTESNAVLYQAVPRSQYPGGSTLVGTGNFILKVLVTEYDDYGNRIKDLGNKLEDNKDSITKALTGFLQ